MGTVETGSASGARCLGFLQAAVRSQSPSGSVRQLPAVAWLGAARILGFHDLPAASPGWQDRDNSPGPFFLMAGKDVRCWLRGFFRDQPVWEGGLRAWA